jgi:NitT/TauT family transport system permease protein
MSDTTLPASARGRRLTNLRLPNPWDIAAMMVVFGVLISVIGVARHTWVRIDAPGATEINLDPSYLPGYAIRTTLRMFAAMAASLVFTFTYATAAAKSRRAGLVLIPILDILQSVPILSFLTFTTAFFMGLFPGNVLGLELAAIFAIFTSQAWNMAFSLYQSLTTLPQDLVDAANSFRLSPWQRFWRLEVPYALPGLIWNTMLSMSGGWFFVVASEAITLGDDNWKLPGIGSYVATALDAKNVPAIVYAIIAMGVVILIYDQLLFRPLVAWSAKFRYDTSVSGAEPEDPWVLKLIRRTRLLRAAGQAIGTGFVWISGRRLSAARRPAPQAAAARPRRRRGDAIFLLLVLAVVLAALYEIITFVAASLAWADLGEAVQRGVYTMIRVVVLIVLAACVWVPAGVWIGMRPKIATKVQPVAQFLAAFPANLFFPPFVIAIVAFHLNPEIWLTPLMILGTQWYILFNVIAGAAAFPSDLREAAANFQVGGWMWWRRVMIPGIMPYFVTGAITASGGAWNAAIVAEVATWGGDHLVATGLGSYLAAAQADPNGMARMVLGTAVMSGFVLLFNRLIWRPLYAYSARRLTL